MFALWHSWGIGRSFFPVPCGRKGSSVETNAERQGGGQRTRKMLSIKLDPRN